MARVRLRVRRVFCGKLIVTNHEQILCILLASRLREIERASQHGCSINDHDFIVCDRVHSIDVRLNAFVREKISG